jgi:hypothetical protein
MPKTAFDKFVEVTTPHTNGDAAAFHKLQVQERKEQLAVDRDARTQLAAEAWKMPAPVPWGLLEARAPVFLIDGYLQQGTVGLLVGKYGTAKSFLALDWGASIAAGTPWQKRDIPVGGNVLYVAAEGGMGMGRRRMAWQQERVKIRDETFYFIPQPVPLGTEEGTRFLADTIRYLGTNFIVIDTLARSIAGLNENDAMDMGVIIDALYQLRDALSTEGTTVLVVQHQGKDDTRGARGSSRLESDVDFCFKITDKETHFALTNTKVKDDARPEPFNFRLRQVSIGAMSSCIIEPCDLDAEDAGKRLCPGCSTYFTPGRTDQVNCSDTCRKRVSRASIAKPQGEGYVAKRRVRF